VTTRSLFPIFEPTGDSPRSPLASQIFRGAHAAGVLRSAAGRPIEKGGRCRCFGIIWLSRALRDFRPAAENDTRAACAPQKRAACATAQTLQPVAPAAFVILPALRRLTNQKTLCAQRSLFAIPRDRGQGVRQRRCDRCRA